jgi:hypothetical protein
MLGVIAYCTADYVTTARAGSFEHTERPGQAGGNGAGDVGVPNCILSYVVCSQP